MFDSFVVHIYFNKSYYIKNTIYPTRKSDINHKNKEVQNKSLIDEVFEKFNQILSILIIRIMEAFFLHHMFGYLEELRDDYDIEPIFTHTVSIRRELLNL